MSLDPVTTVLVASLDYELRQVILSRRESMLRQLRFLDERGDTRLKFVRSHGWNRKDLEVLCGLNAFYQLVLGPLASSARDRHGVLGADTPILYGKTLRFDWQRSTEIRSAHAAFMSALDGVPKAHRIVTAPHFDDLLYRLARALEEPDGV